MVEHPVKQPIRTIIVSEFEGAAERYDVGQHGVTRIEACTKSGMYADVPYVRVWARDVAVAEFCQHHIIGVHFDGRSK